MKTRICLEIRISSSVVVNTPKQFTVFFVYHIHHVKCELYVLSDIKSINIMPHPLDPQRAALGDNNV